MSTCEYPLPEPLARRLQTYTEYDEIIKGMCAERAVTLRLNALRGPSRQTEKMLSALGIRFRHAEWYSDALIVENVREDTLKATQLYRDGAFYLQNLSSMLPPVLLDPQPGENILDMTAAPGGKTTQLAALSGGQALITACERDKIRFERLKFNLARQGAMRVNTMHTDALLLDEALKFDKILLDAPCTGSGTILLPGNVRFTEDFLARCVRMQKKLLFKALRLLKKGGTLVYSTCSVLREENDEVIKTAQKAGARCLPAEIPAEIPRLPSRSETACVCPNVLYEGFYVAKLTI